LIALLDVPVCSVFGQVSCLFGCEVILDRMGMELLAPITYAVSVRKKRGNVSRDFGASGSQCDENRLGFNVY